MLAGSSFVRKAERASIFGHWDQTEEEKGRPKPLLYKLFLPILGRK
jgi:hypothetical protein